MKEPGPFPATRLPKRHAAKNDWLSFVSNAALTSAERGTFAAAHPLAIKGNVR